MPLSHDRVARWRAALKRVMTVQPGTSGRFCAYCGARIRSAGWVCQRCGRELPRG